MTIFVTGGCKNGKSTFALRQAVKLAEEGKRFYVATMLPQDAHEWDCVHRHREARKGLGFTTLEQGRNLPLCLNGVDTNGVFLLDSITALLANEMFPPDTSPVLHAGEQIQEDLELFLDSVEHAVIVSDHVCSDGEVFSTLSEDYRRSLASLECFLAARCDCVAEICAGHPIIHKGQLAST